jgi:hypothetical protein
MPARYFVVGIQSLPSKPAVFYRTVVTFGFCFRNFFALNFLISERVFLGNFSIAMLPIMSWGIFFMVNRVCKDIKMLLVSSNHGIEGE